MGYTSRELEVRFPQDFSGRVHARDAVPHRVGAVRFE